MPLHRKRAAFHPVKRIAMLKKNSQDDTKHETAGVGKRGLFLGTPPAIIASLAAMALLVALSLTLLFQSLAQVEAASKLRLDSFMLLKSANNLLTELVNAETGARGYMLTNDESFLKPYISARSAVYGNLTVLRSLAKELPSNSPLAALQPMFDAKMEYLAKNIELQAQGDTASAVLNMRGSQGQALTELIRTEIAAIVQPEETLFAARETTLQSRMRQMFASIAATTILTLLFFLLFAWLLYRETRQRLKNLVYLETKRLLEAQTEISQSLLQANVTLQLSEEKLAVTLNSIGDAVLTTDFLGRITGLNPIAEKLTGWRFAEAEGRPVDEVFKIVNQETRKPATIPVMETLSHGTIQGLANHTVLISRDGSECAIADSCAPIRDRSSKVIGAILVFRNVSQEYEAQQALRDSTALIQTILNTVPDGIITIQARGGVIEAANPAALAMFGYDATELVGKSFSMLIPELDKDQKNGSLEYYGASDAARAVGLGREVSGRRKDGSDFPLEIALSEMLLGGQRFFTGILRDTTARKKSEAALLKEGALQSAIFNSENFSSIATDAKGVIQIFNVGAERMLGYQAFDVMNKITPADFSDAQEILDRAQSLSNEFGNTITPGFEALVFKASRGIEDIYELTYIRKDGTKLPAVVSVTALRDAQNAIIGYLLIGTDNTMRKLIEGERTYLDKLLLDKNAELELARMTAEKANMAKSDFLSSMSHELRTPLSAVLGFAQLIESGTPAPTPAQKRSIDQILKAGWYLLELINEILDLALIESGKLSLSVEPVAMIEVMYECETMIEPQAKKRGINVAFTQFPVPYYVKGDRTRVKQVILNLLSNAIKYNKVGGTVSVECAATASDSFRISVRDTGSGLSPDQISQLFQPFNRLGQEAKVEEGTGIGLVVCKRLVELMGGVIGVESAVGEGSVFWFELNLTLRPQLAEYPGMPAIADQSPEPGKGYTLLYVEDNPANLMLVEDLIARRPEIRLLSARDGNQGVELARAALPDVILMDINLPGISGIQALSILLEDPKTARIPVIALSANAIPRDIEKGLRAGFFRYLTKPIKVNEFMDTLDEALKAKEAGKKIVLSEETA